MAFKRKRTVRLDEDEIEALEALSFIIDSEADNVEEIAPEAPASPVSQVTVDSIPTIAQMLRAIAEWIRSLLNRIGVL